jgi:hypothetical protein
MSQVDVPAGRLRFGQTARKDAWWVSPLVTLVAMGVGFGYLTWGLFQSTNYWSPPYLTPLASPLLFGEGPHAWISNSPPSWWPATLPFMPGLFILWIPVPFRATCYYYRGSYYKALFADPPNCAVGEPRHRYRGESSFPLVLQNVHRFFMYGALLFIPILLWDVLMATRFPVAAGATETSFGIGLGTLIMLVNVVAVALYTFSCHSFRHVIGGVLDHLSSSPRRKKLYDCASCLNQRHMLWAWLSLYTMCVTDGYIRLCAAGVIHDWRII